jgi:hypothetical protein
MSNTCDHTHPSVPTVNDLYGRLFATWTLLTCGLCLICARNPTNPAIYGAPALRPRPSAWQCMASVLKPVHPSPPPPSPCTLNPTRRHPAVVCRGAGPLSHGAAGLQDDEHQGRGVADGCRRCGRSKRGGGRQQQLHTSRAQSRDQPNSRMSTATSPPLARSPRPTGLSTLWMGAGWNYYTYHATKDDAAAATGDG